ncbi:MAG TPA: DUF4398 domain-containing protein [Gammaproteobacteria bacterium]|nr:DUF4398 domain-containing protein [Gammaproteobacteria bacterium]
MKIKSVLFGASVPAAMLLTAIALNGCTSVAPRPDDALVRAKTAVDQATTAGSSQYAPVDLNTAGAKLQSANEEEAKGNYKQAKYLAEESQVDAELALAKTQDAKAQEAANQVRKGNQALQNQVDQTNNPPLM